MKGRQFKVSKIVMAMTFAMMTSALQASGYKMEFQSASTLADAGEAAVVEDAGTNWYNSAGLVYLPQQLALSAIDLDSSTRFNGTTTAPSMASPLFNYSATGRASSNSNSILPGIHYAHPIKDRYAFGLSVVPAWGFVEDYGSGSILRYDLKRVYTKTIDVAPSAAMKLNNQWSIGLGPDMHYFAVQSKTMVNTIGITTQDSVSRFSASNWGYGWHTGLLFRLDDATRIGVNYRSKLIMNMDGYSTFVLAGLTTYETDQFKLKIALPPTTTFSVYHDLTPRFALMGTIAYDQWSILRAYTAKNYIGPPTIANPSGLINVSVPQKMNNTFDFSVGTHYKLNDQWMLRGSLKLEPTPTKDAYRDVNFPDGDKLGVNFGARYQINKKLKLDLIYAHVFTKQASINAVNQVTGSTASGHTNTNMDLFGAQLVWDI